MRVVLKERELEYQSDYPDGWLKGTANSYKCPVVIGKYQTFIKRFELKKANEISGFDLLFKLKGKAFPGLPIVYDIIRAEEYRKEVIYLFEECLQGKTLEEIVSNGGSIDLKKMTYDLFISFKSIHSQSYWYSTFTEKSIFYDEKKRQFLLISIENSKLVSVEPGRDFTDENDYSILVFRFLEEIAVIKVGDGTVISGAILNYLEFIFLILHLKVTIDANKYEYKSNDVFTILPQILDDLNPLYRKIFSNTLTSERAAPDSDFINDIRTCIEDIIERNFDDLEIMRRPLIKVFKSNINQVVNNETFQLYWEVENSQNLELHKNGVLYKRLDPGEKAINITESFDGKPKRISYTLLAVNKAGGTKSEPLIVSLSENYKKNTETLESALSDVPRVLNQGSIRNSNKKSVIKIRTILIMLVILIGVIFSVITYYVTKKTDKYFIYQREVIAGGPLVIFGDKFPKDSGLTEVYFDTLKGEIVSYSENSINVVVPEVSQRLDSIKVAIVIKGDTNYALGNLSIKPSIKVADSKSQPEIVISEPEVKKIEHPYTTVRIPLKGRTKKQDKVLHSSDTSKASPLTNKVDVVTELPKKLVNIFDFVSVTNNDFKKKTLGGVKDLKVTVKNDSKYDLDVVSISITYQKNNEKEIKKEILVFKNIMAHSSATLDAPSTSRGKKVQLKIESIKSAQLEKDRQ